MTTNQQHADRGVDSAYAWMRLGVCLALGTIGGVGMWSVAVALPAVQAEFGVMRGAASFPYTMTMLGLALGGILMGRIADRWGVAVVVVIGGLMLGLGYFAASRATSLWQFTAIHGLLIGALGASTTFGPLVADTSLWFEKRRGLAVALCASGNYLAGAVWPPIVQLAIATWGWRQTYLMIAIACTTLLVPMALLLLRRPPAVVAVDGGSAPGANVTSPRPLGHKPNSLLTLLLIAGIACCVGMSMPQVHIVAYCGDLGYGVQRGAEMLAIMLAAGIVSRLVSGWICDHIGGLATLLLGSSLQCLMLLAYLPFDGLTSLYVISALFGLVQGGIVPSYAIIVRENFAPSEAGWRVSAVLMSTVAGMALGGWLSGLIFDLTGSYRAAFLHGIAWNIVNLAIALHLFSRSGQLGGPQTARA